MNNVIDLHQKTTVQECEFQIAVPPDGEMQMVSGLVVGRFGIVELPVYDEYLKEDTTAYSVTHLRSGWRVALIQDYFTAEKLAFLCPRS
jgi:hypothetical protein